MMLSRCVFTSGRRNILGACRFSDTLIVAGETSVVLNLRILTYRKFTTQIIENKTPREITRKIHGRGKAPGVNIYPSSIMIFLSTNAVRYFVLCGCLALLLPPAVVAQDDAAQDAVAIFNRAQDLHEKGDLAGAIKLYDEAIKAMPEFPEAEYQRGTACLALGDQALAEKSFRRAIELRSDWTLPMTSLGSLLVRKGAYAEAESILKKVIALEPQNPPALVAWIDLKLKTRASTATLEPLLAQITTLTSKANPTPSSWTARAALESALGKREAAKKSLAGVIASDPKNRAALFQLADIAIAESDLVKAKEIAGHLLGNAADVDALNLLNANIAAFEMRYDDAIKFLDEIKNPPPAASELRARIKAVRSDNAGELEKQLESDAKNSAILGRLCALFRRDDPVKALEYCRRASEAEPGNITHAIGFGAALVQAKQFDHAVSLFRRILETAPDNATARANLATALFQLKRLPEAKSEFQWLTSAQPRSAGAYLFLGIIHDQLGEFLDAAANYQQYLRLADPVENKLDIEKVNLRLPALQKKVKVKSEK